MNDTPRRRDGLRHLVASIGALSLLLVTIGCSEPEEPLLSVPYHDWDETTEQLLDFTVPGHGSGLRKIYANSVVFETPLPETGEITYPAGAVFVKEVYETPAPSAEDTPAMLVGMVKAPDDPRSQGGWVWVTRNPADETETVFTDRFCITCHGNANEEHPYGSGNPDGAFRDYIFHTPAIEGSR
ncbi:MAG: cytochrome P460 family protein [Alkalispirochaeta sp.]